MTLRLEREELTPGGYHGRLFIDGTLVGVTLEDPVKYIPVGTYSLVLRYSPKFQMLLPEVYPVPGRTAILIHAGNREEDTEGCILLGNYRVDDEVVAESRAALGRLLTRYRDWNDGLIEVVAVA